MGTDRTGMNGQPQPMFSGGSVTPQPMFGQQPVMPQAMFSGMSANAQQTMPMQAQGQAINLWDLPTTALKMPTPPLTPFEQFRMNGRNRDAPVVEEAPYRSPMFAPFGAPQPQPVEQPYVNPIFSMFRRP